MKPDLPFLGIRRNRVFCHHSLKSPPAKVLLVRKYVDRLDSKIRLKRMLVEEFCANTKVSHVKLSGDAERKQPSLEVPQTWSNSVVFHGSWGAAFGTWILTQNTQARLLRYQDACSSVNFEGGLRSPESPVGRHGATSMPLTVMC